MPIGQLNISAVFKSLAMGLAVILAPPLLAQEQLRILDTPSLTGNGTGWSVDPATGSLQFDAALAVLPGEIPLPVSFRMNGTSSIRSRTNTYMTWIDPVTGLKPVSIFIGDDGKHYGIDADGNTVDVVYRSVTSSSWSQVPIEGGIHFGGVGSGGSGVGLVLEDGRFISDTDWVTNQLQPATFKAPAAFGLNQVPSGTTLNSALMARWRSITCQQAPPFQGAWRTTSWRR